MDWTLVFWGCFLGGLLLTALHWILGDLLEGLVEGITGGSPCSTRWSGWEP